MNVQCENLILMILVEPNTLPSVCDMDLSNFAIECLLPGHDATHIFESKDLTGPFMETQLPSEICEESSNNPTLSSTSAHTPTPNCYSNQYTTV